ncbi:hypothetical protein CYLTODRAFT_427070 [Cylindrobasidium torrendii FP15055 ss-10]|uniref:Uncharacterized protein n=1 Tax=Cylindrobasidium torrendii FP15055 ss-10 TaxID=1314674 RepID=A0A0D7AW67_9AGAR|nr:hypothetical protein CYLTODRAFT_427070 [Cylindrobasidium torrendii FP15055 ss-10]
MSESTISSYRSALVGGIFPDPKDPSKELIMTSPNMVALPYPLLHHERRSVSVFQDERCGFDDYLLHPQPFISQQAHLALAVAPDLSAPNTPRAILHQELQDRDWFLKAGAQYGFGCIDPALSDVLQQANQQLLSRFQSLREAAKANTANSDDEKVYATRSRDIFMLKHFNGCLQATGTFADCVRVWASCQRLHIEILAFIDFMTEFRALFLEPPSSPRPVDLNRIGAITTNAATAESLFLVGLPVYYVRARGEVDIKKVVRLLSPEEMSKLLQERVIVRVGHQAGAPTTQVLFRPTHPSSPYPVIFNGSPTSANRLKAIFAWSQKTHPLQVPADEHDATHIADIKKYGLDDIRQPGGSVQAASGGVSSSVVSSASGSGSGHPVVHSTQVSTSPSAEIDRQPILQDFDSHSTRQQNPLRPGRGRGLARRGRGSSSRTTRSSQNVPKGPKVVPRNKWIRTSDFMPESLAVWEEQSRILGEGHSDSLPPSWPGSTSSWRNYVVPEPGMVAGMPDKQRECALLNCARFRDAFAYRVEHDVSTLKNSTWRFICTIGYVVPSTSRPSSGADSEETETMKKRAGALEEFNKSILDAGLTGTLMLDNLASTVLWRGAELSADAPMSRHIAQAILGDLNEMSFRWELANLDGELYDRTRFARQQVDDVDIYGQDGIQSMNRKQRRWEVVGSMTYFNGTFAPNIEDFYNEPRGFSSGNLADRVEALLDLAHLMDEWIPRFRISRDALDRIETLSKLHRPLLSMAAVAVTIAEREIASTYIRAFKEVFARAPILPSCTYLPM